MGTKVFTRVGKLENLLDSVDGELIGTVYLADDGHATEEKERLYARDWPFELEVLDLEYDAGLGRGRAEIVEQCSEEYLLLVDPDHVVPHNVTRLVDQLRARPDVGAVAGSLVEPEQSRMYLAGHDFETDGDALVRGADLNRKDIEFVAGSPFVEFDFIPNAAVFDVECFADYSWDPGYVIEYEHLDFYVGHWRRTDWSFGVCPEVIFRHYPGGGERYLANREDDEKIRQSRRHFLKKWGYDRIHVTSWWWYHSPSPPPKLDADLMTRAIDVLRTEGPRRLLASSFAYLADRVRRRTSR